MVAPLVGAWIEMAYLQQWREILVVAPLVGAWIEIKGRFWTKIIISVAPLVGAWIEMIFCSKSCIAFNCRTPCGCVD